jgi:hypothetical protein
MFLTDDEEHRSGKQDHPITSGTNIMLHDLLNGEAQ